ncbi:DNA ligase D [Aquibacillus salsiterrae]|uniref:DNA ligase (ATP) n=1 Tax=Aquibacillus salsiterrae TaxID=2950439 RepID=A0A9X3WD61_9BACI|nr:DNA ligase D [Aquibacillus salsiterrae]MDC3416818.1 DNA ligase D [Aquibacillus salsiterrae]
MMQPKPSEAIPKGKEWCYEVKYDGFRARLHWDQHSITLISRNGKDLTNNFPEIIAYCQQKSDEVIELLPLQFDGEIVILNTKFQANFEHLQQRGRFKSAEKITRAATRRPAHFLCFDILQIMGKSLVNLPYQQRKNKLKETFCALHLDLTISWYHRLGFVAEDSKADEIWQTLFDHLGEGIVAKRLDSNYTEGKTHGDWFKIKNWRVISGILTSYHQENGYFSVAVYGKDKLVTVGKFKHGLEGEALTTIKQLLHTKGIKSGNTIHLPPAICVDIHCLGFSEGEFREPQFKQFRFDLEPEACTVKLVKDSLSQFPATITLTKQAKIFWPESGTTKGDLLRYIRQIAPYMVPFTRNKALTVIRCPDGVNGEFFYQKHLPDYGPDYVGGMKQGEEILLHAGSIDALVWLANHGAIEYHVPFQLMGESIPNEIVFDLDPASIDDFDVAVYAATLLKTMLDQFKLKSFVKTSGNKGMQVYVPIQKQSMTYEETAAFTQSIAFLLEKQHPDLFTTERLKKNRNNRLYIDYIQHGKDKTLIAPYSPRKTKEATVSTPLFWEEVTSNLTPTAFTVNNVVARVKDQGCPFSSYEEARDTQDLSVVKQFLSET